MTRGQRRAHALVWPLLALGLAGLILGAMAERARLADAAVAAVEAG